MLIRHRVTDYVVGRRAFHEHGATGSSNGCWGRQVFRNADDPQEMLLLLTWDDLVRARLYVHSDEMLESMKSAGVADEQGKWFLELADEVER